MSQQQMAFSAWLHRNPDTLEQDCKPCGGTGWEGCDECDGTGFVDCDTCDGGGCKDCDGAGEIACELCSDGDVQCEHCNGSSNASLSIYREIKAREKKLASLWGINL